MTKSLLCLGDSYTIGENVPLHESFPYQTIQLLRQLNMSFHAPEIVAKTGWTSFELMAHLNQIILEQHYDFATLLVGVNNQYRGLSIEDFAKDFELLLKKAIDVVGKNTKKVIVLSIPDWGVTPFAKERNEQQIFNEINAYNGVCELLAQKYQTHFINITDSTRKAKQDESLLAADGLHYSAKEHLVWAKLVADIISKNS
ncbi:MAG: SGNH/GDSL hydrolase family protein [Chitinophagaceae bacterium]|nr:SGNH/GDSL hydrolase family protein [Chitinophagaceae bacterium]